VAGCQKEQNSHRAGQLKTEQTNTRNAMSRSTVKLRIEAGPRLQAGSRIQAGGLVKYDVNYGYPRCK